MRAPLPLWDSQCGMRCIVIVRAVTGRSSPYWNHRGNTLVPNVERPSACFS